MDSSVWIAAFNGDDTPEARRLRTALAEEEDVVVLDLILAEVLQGFRSDSQFEAARAVLTSHHRATLARESYVSAARLFRRLRSRGVTVRGVVDCVIAQACVELGATLLTADRDFRQMARHERLTIEPAV